MKTMLWSVQIAFHIWPVLQNSLFTFTNKNMFYLKLQETKLIWFYFDCEKTDLIIYIFFLVTDSWCYRKQVAGFNPPGPSEAILPRSTQGPQIPGQQAG